MDRTLEQAVLSALYLEPLINAERVVVTARDGVVTLTGEVDSQAQKSAARYKAQCVPGVTEVADELEVCARAQPRPGFDDVAASVLNALYWDLAVPPDRVCVKFDKGWVTLTGEVDRPYQKSSAEADVRKTPRRRRRDQRDQGRLKRRREDRPDPSRRSDHSGRVDGGDRRRSQESKRRTAGVAVVSAARARRALFPRPQRKTSPGAFVRREPEGKR